MKRVHRDSCTSSVVCARRSRILHSLSFSLSRSVTLSLLFPLQNLRIYFSYSLKCVFSTCERFARRFEFRSNTFSADFSVKKINTNPWRSYFNSFLIVFSVMWFAKICRNQSFWVAKIARDRQFMLCSLISDFSNALVNFVDDNNSA